MCANRCVPAAAGLIIAALLFFLPHPLLATLRVDVTSIRTLGGSNDEFQPGERIQYQVRFLVSQTGGAVYTVRLRITGDGWYEVLKEEVSLGLGTRILNWGISPELYTSTDVCKGKVSLNLDIASSLEEEIIIGGRRHSYFTIVCPPDIPSGTIRSVDVGKEPFDMAFTRDGRYLYVTSQESRTITIIDTNNTDPEDTTPFKTIPDWEKINKEVAECRSLCPPGDDACREACNETIEPVGEPTGVEASVDGTRMYVADYTRPVIHIVDAQTHEFAGSLSLSGFAPTKLTGLALNPPYNEIYVTDSRDARVMSVNLGDQSVRALDLRFLDPLRGINPRGVIVDPFQSNSLWVLSNEVILIFRIPWLYPRTVLKMNFPRYLRWDMALSPLSTPINRELYVVLSPGVSNTPFPYVPRSFIHFWNVTFLPPGVNGEAFEVGASIGDLVIQDNGRYAYTPDSYRGGILLVDLDRRAEIRGCAIPAKVGALRLIADPNPLRNRLYVGTWDPGSVDFVE